MNNLINPYVGGGGGVPPPPSLLDVDNWWKARDLVLSDDDLVDIWSGGDYTATATGSDRPTYKAGGGTPYVLFNTSQMITDLALNYVDFTIIAVCEWVSEGVGDRLLDKNYVDGLWMGCSMDGPASDKGGGVLEAVSPFGAFNSFGTGAIACMLMDREIASTNRRYWLNGTHADNTVATTTLDNSVLVLGATEADSDYGNFKLFELILTQSRVPSMQITDEVDPYLMYWYGENFA